MKTIEYSATGIPFNDFEVEEKAKSFLLSLEDYESYIDVSTSNFIDCVRLCIVQQVIPHQEVVFIYNLEKIIPNEYGNLNKWPKGFCDLTINIVPKIIRAGIERRKLKNESPLSIKASSFFLF